MGRELLPKEKTQAANQLWRFLGTSACEVRKGDPATRLPGIQAFPHGVTSLAGRGGGEGGRIRLPEPGGNPPAVPRTPKD